MRKLISVTMCAALFAVTACKQGNQGSASGISDSNPFLKPSPLAFQAPEFDKIHDTDFLPAFIEGMRLDSLDRVAIADNKEAPSFDNTFLALEKAGQMFQRVNAVFSLLVQANSTPELLKVKEEVAPLLTAHSDGLYMNSKLFQRVEDIYTKRASLQLDQESLRLVEVTYQRFVLAGAKLSEEDKAKMKELNKEEASLMAKFTTCLQAANKDLQNTTQQPALASMDDREARHKLFMESWNRTEKGDKNDTRKIILRIAAIRIEQANLLGFKNYADWKLQDQMAKNSETVNFFLEKLVPAATHKVAQEAKDIQALIDKKKLGFKLEAWDWDYFSEQVRKEKFDINEEAVKPYFELNRVLIDGVFYAATQLYGITFKERKDLPVYQEDVRVFDVFDKDGKQLGLFYCDYYKRDNKDGGAWMSNLVNQSTVLGTIPVIYNVCNFQKPKAGEPALISFDDVTTMFHEFGHGLHGLFASQKYPSLSGANTARDFVEFPSQFNEHWASDPKILKNYAKHYQTGAVIPEALLQKLLNASTFNEGYRSTELFASSCLDMQWHSLTKGTKVDDVDKFEAEALKKTGFTQTYAPPRYRSSYFLHIWANGYAAGYYAYTWTSMLDFDAYAWFREHGGLTRENGQRFRDMILSKGNSDDLAKLYKAFRGQEPDIKPMLEMRGLTK